MKWSLPIRRNGASDQTKQHTQAGLDKAGGTTRKLTATVGNEAPTDADKAGREEHQ